jgi:hypothetical protein
VSLPRARTGGDKAAGDKQGKMPAFSPVRWARAARAPRTPLKAPAASAPEIAADLERAGRIMNERLREIDALHKLVRDRGGKDNEQ